MAIDPTHDGKEMPSVRWWLFVVRIEDVDRYFRLDGMV